ncbi:MAG: TRAP transporter large permease subunit [Dehalococcoidales bacterium]|nr:TRAP transporter large permease subunit [Dehalococcoidales bacterium]
MELWMVITILVGGLVILLALGVPVAFTLGSLSVLFFIILFGFKGLTLLAGIAWDLSTNFTVVCLPLFVLMAEIICECKIAEDAFKSASKWLSWLPGGLGVSTIAGSAVSAAMIGTSTGNTAVVGVMATPEMIKNKYTPSLATGSVAAGGALGVLIPPSGLFILFGILFEQSIGKLFIAGLVPGVMLAAMFVMYIVIFATIKPEYAPALKGVTWRERWFSLKDLWAVIILVVAIFYLLYSGAATPTEIAGLGAFIALIIGLAYRRLSMSGLKRILLRTVTTTCMLMWILFGAFSLTYILTYFGLPASLATWVGGLEVSPLVVIIGINVLLIFMGMILDPAAIIMLVAPIFYPMITQLGFDPLWFCVMFVVNMEMAEITPPFGLNLFVMKGLFPEIPMSTVIRGVIPFVIIQLIALALVVAFPQIALWLPGTMSR